MCFIKIYKKNPKSQIFFQKQKQREFHILTFVFYLDDNMSPNVLYGPYHGKMDEEEDAVSNASKPRRKTFRPIFSCFILIVYIAVFIAEMAVAKFEFQTFDQNPMVNTTTTTTTSSSTTTTITDTTTVKTNMNGLTHIDCETFNRQAVTI